jgi:hypothetical protein
LLVNPLDGRIRGHPAAVRPRHPARPVPADPAELPGAGVHQLGHDHAIRARQRTAVPPARAAADHRPRLRAGAQPGSEPGPRHQHHPHRGRNHASTVLGRITHLERMEPDRPEARRGPACQPGADDHRVRETSAADATIALYDAKYHYPVWRPVTAIQLGNTIGNPGITGNPTWLCRGHRGRSVLSRRPATISEAAATVLAASTRPPAADRHSTGSGRHPVLRLLQAAADEATLRFSLYQHTMIDLVSYTSATRWPSSAQPPESAPDSTKATGTPQAVDATPGIHCPRRVRRPGDDPVLAAHVARGASTCPSGSLRTIQPGAVAHRGGLDRPPTSSRACNGWSRSRAGRSNHAANRARSSPGTGATPVVYVRTFGSGNRAATSRARPNHRVART